MAPIATTVSEKEATEEGTGYDTEATELEEDFSEERIARELDSVNRELEELQSKERLDSLAAAAAKRQEMEHSAKQAERAAADEIAREKDAEAERLDGEQQAAKEQFERLTARFPADDLDFDTNALILQTYWQKRQKSIAVRAKWLQLIAQLEEAKRAREAVEAARTTEEKRVKELISGLDLDTEEGTCRRLVRQLMAIYSPSYNPYLKMTMPCRLFAKLSKVHWLTLVMQEGPEEIDVWDGKSDIPKPRNMPDEFMEKFKAFYDDELKHNKADIQSITAEDEPVPSLPPAKTSTDWVRFARNAYNIVRHCMPKGTTRPEVHAMVIKELSRCTSKPEFEMQLASLKTRLHKSKFPEQWRDVPATRQGTTSTKPTKATATPPTAAGSAKNSSAATAIGTKRRTAAAAAAAAAAVEADATTDSRLRKRPAKTTTFLPGNTFAAPKKKRKSSRRKKPKRKTASTEHDGPPAKKSGVGTRIVYNSPSEKWQRERLERSNNQQLFINHLYIHPAIEPGEIEYQGFGAVVPCPEELSETDWEAIAQAHGRLVVLATGAIELETTFFQGAGPKGIESVSLKKVTHNKWRSSVGTWVPEGMQFGALQASFAILITQNKLSDQDQNQFIIYRDLIKEKFAPVSAKSLFDDIAAILRCYALFASTDPLIAKDTLPKEELDAGVVVFEEAKQSMMNQD